MSGSLVDQDLAVQQRYSSAAKAPEAALCCAVSYDPRLLKVIPPEVVERDYGCGDPSRFVRPGDTVLDLGSGTGKICFIAAQLVGPNGKVVGVDRNADMLAVARAAAPVVAERIGYANVSFACGEIQDLALDLEKVDAALRARPVRDRDDLAALEAETSRLRREAPLIPDASVDVVVSNCVLNLVADGDRGALFRELFRVVKPGGRVAISDIVSDEDVPPELRADPDLWSGCASGAYREDRFLEAFVAAGFYGATLAKRDETPWRVERGIEFRSVTVVAYKGEAAPCLEGNHAIVYRGPWREVADDAGHVFRRGERTAVCAKTYALMMSAPYGEDCCGVPPYREIPAGEMKEFVCGPPRVRTPAETKNGPRLEAPASCAPDGGCC